ncbi:hypothetical protein DFO73_1331 [Cytobacillus oceanisediminis]|uniref:Uncharacterized protein n=1 Tax=Cytobacillus oceanisediminis TaxID=665099 RepID=A0A2V2ZBZ2_9BACI|nr:hypothetical protein DFO73_1331 [Cytobacillus oceanisediminis]
MIYPTVISKESNLVHIVKDQNTCVCGFTYNAFATFTKKDLKKIKFKPEKVITCPNCKSIIK